MDNKEFYALAHQNKLSLAMFSEMTVAADLYRKGHRVSKPLDNDQKYDLVLDKGGILQRVQVKTLSQNGYQVPLGHTSYFYKDGSVDTKDHLKYHQGHFDVLAVVDRKTGTVYYIPSSDIDYTKANFSLAGKHAQYLDV
jgi:hypothetical protein